jgi:hypothetical protein
MREYNYLFKVLAVLIGGVFRLGLEILGLVVPDSLDEGGVALCLRGRVVVVHCI